MSTRAAVFGLAVIAAVVTVVGSLAPWAWLGTIAYDGTQASSGRVALAMAVFAIALLGAAVLRRTPWLAVLAAVPAAAVGGIAAYHASDPDRFVGSSLSGIASVGWGAIVTVAASAALAGLSLLEAWLLRRSP